MKPDGSDLLPRFALPDGFGTLLVDDAERFPEGELLFGFVQGKRSICVGTEGLTNASSEELEELRSSIDGRFAAIFDEGDAWVARTDFACQEQLFLYQSEDGWILGSSLFEVATRAAARGMRLSREPRHARSLQRGMLRRMPTGLLTPFAQIRRLPIGADVRIDKRSRGLTPRLRTVEEGLSRYADMTVDQIAQDFVDSWVGTLASMQHRSRLVCDLTGGYDSRLVFALAMRASALTEIEVRTFSNRTRKEDWDIARSITDTLGLLEPNNAFKYPDGVSRAALDPMMAFSVWLHSAFDGRVGLELPSTAAIPNGSFSFQTTGHVAMTARFDANHSAYASAVAKTERRAAEPGLMADHLDMLATLGVEPEARLAMPYVFMQCFSPNHSGSNWRWALGGTIRVTPLTHSAYVALYLAADRKNLNLRAIQAGLLDALDPRLKAWPHAKASETWSSALSGGAPLSVSAHGDIVIPRILGGATAANISNAPDTRSPSETLDHLVQEVPELRRIDEPWRQLRESTPVLQRAEVAPNQNLELQKAAELGIAARQIFLDALVMSGPPEDEVPVG